MKTKMNVLKYLLTTGIAASDLAGRIHSRADIVTDWNQNMLTAAFTAKLGPLVTSRVSAMVQSAVFDAVNGTH